MRALFKFNREAEAARFLRVTPASQSESGQLRFVKSVSHLSGLTSNILMGAAIVFGCLAGVNAWHKQWMPATATATFALLVGAYGRKRGQQANFYRSIATTIEQKGVYAARKQLKEIAGETADRLV